MVVDDGEGRPAAEAMAGARRAGVEGLGERARWECTARLRPSGYLIRRRRASYDRRQAGVGAGDDAEGGGNDEGNGVAVV